VQTWVALLRGVNVGGRNRLAMADLRAVHEALGHVDVRTYVQSGNVVFRRTPTDESLLAEQISHRLLADLGLACAVVVRSARDLSGVVAANPFADRIAADPGTKALHVTFLDGPAAGTVGAALAGVDPAAYAPDELLAGARHVYLWCPGGYGRTRLTPVLFERRTGATATDRGWTTVVALAEMANDDASI
jgi:uncharacterized protein (DUF1697 family)